MISKAFMIGWVVTFWNAPPRLIWSATELIKTCNEEVESVELYDASVERALK